MNKKNTQLSKLTYLFLTSILLYSGLGNAQTNAKNPIYDMSGNELVSKRDLFSKHFQNEDGSINVAICAEPIHFKKDQNYLNINNSISPFSSTIYPYANLENLMESHFGSTAHQGVKNKTIEGEVLEFLNTSMYWEVSGNKVNEIISQNVPVTISSNKAYYNDIFGTIDAEFVVSNGKRKLNYILPNSESLSNVPTNAEFLVFSENIVLPSNWSFIKNENGLIIYNEKQEKIYKYSNPFSYDANGKKLRSNNTLFDVASQGNIITITTKVKTSWLLNAERVFPITVDPSVTVYPDMTNYNTGSVYSSDYLKLTADIGFGRDVDNAGAEDFLRGWAKFNTASLPEDAIVSNGVTINYYVFYASADYSPANGHELVFSQINFDPVTASGNILYDAIGQFGYSPFVTAAINSVGWKSHTITSGAIQTNISNGLINDYFAIGFMPQGDFFPEEFIAVDGWDNEKPYLTFNYTQPLSSIDYNKIVNLYPNPTENIINVGTEYQVEEAKIYSLLGQLMLTSKNNKSIDLSSLSKGLYLVEIKLDNDTIVRQRIVKN